METSRYMERFFPSRVVKSLQGPRTKIDLLQFDEFFIPVTKLWLNNEVLNQELLYIFCTIEISLCSIPKKIKVAKIAGRTKNQHVVLLKQL